MSDTTTSIDQKILERLRFLEAEVARISLFMVLFQETKRLNLDVSKFP